MDTRHGNEFRLPIASHQLLKQIGGKQRLSYQAIKEWNNLSDVVKQSSNISQFNFLKHTI
jgi:hypothetical protein